MHKCYSLFILIVIIGVFAVEGFAQSPKSRVAIIVKDGNGMVVPGADVGLIIDGHILRRTTSGADGLAVFDSISEGTYRVSAASKGFSTAVKEILIRAGKPESVELTLSPGTIAETVNVTAERRQISSEDTAVPVSVIDREEIEKKAVNTIGDVFRTLPGTSTVNEGGFQVRPRIRGLDSNRVLILVDGERLNNSRTSTGQSGVETGLIELSQVESVEVVRGSGSVLYGTDALGGTINIITRDTPLRRDSGLRFGAALDTFYSSNEKGRRGSLALNGSGKYFAFRFAQSLERFDNYFTGKPNAGFLLGLRNQGFGITDDGEALNSQSHGSNSAATVRFFVNDKNTLKFNYDRRRASNIGSAGLVGTFNGFFPFSNREKVGGRFDSVALTRYLQRVSISGFLQTQNRNFSNILTVPPAPPFFPGLYQVSSTVTDTITTGFDVQTDWTLGSRNNLVAGVSFFRDSNKDNRLVVTGSTPISPSPRSSTTKSVPDASLTNFAGFAQDEFRLTNRLKVIGGIRVDNFKTVSQTTTGFALPALLPDQIDFLRIGNIASGINKSNTSVTGDFGAVYKLTTNISLSGRVGRSFRTPNLFEMFFTDRGSVSGSFVAGNLFLKPETGTNVDTSVKVKTSRYAASVTYFNNSYKNLLATVPTVDRNGQPIFLNQPGPATRVYQTQNIDRARIQGFEAEFEVPIKIRLGFLSPNGYFSYLRGDDTGRKVPLDFISPMRTNIGIRWNNYGKSYFFDYYARIVRSQHRLSPSFLSSVNQSGNGVGFVTHNMSGGYYFRRERYNFNINLGISNIFNRAYSEQFVFAPARGRSFTVGTTWTLK